MLLMLPPLSAGDPDCDGNHGTKYVVSPYGGEGGIKHFMEHLSGPVASWWKDPGKLYRLARGKQGTIVDGVLRRRMDAASMNWQSRDEVPLQLVKLRMPQ